MASIVILKKCKNILALKKIREIKKPCEHPGKEVVKSENEVLIDFWCWQVI